MQKIAREVITVQNAAKLLKISPEAVRTLIKKKKLAGFQLDKRWRLFVDSIPVFNEKEEKNG